jgi:transcription elongation factor Elf1
MLFRRLANCPVCSKSTSSGTLAVISPWIRELGIKSRLSKYFICENCESGFFTKRYTSDEMSKIYSEYRGNNYLRKRSKWEPWYTSSYNSNHDSDDWIKARKESLTEFLIRNKIDKCDVIVDVGGDRGQYIPDIAATKIVIDLSDKTLCQNVTRINRIEDSPFANLIIYAHVLEHVSNPVQELKSLFRNTNQIYIEVPFGIPEINKYRRSLGRLVFHLLSSTSPGLWSRSARPATGRKVSPTKMLTQSEHLTFFTEQSFVKISELLGVTLVMEQNTIRTPDFSEGAVLQCLLTKPYNHD